VPDDRLLTRIRAEYLEMPGLRLTPEQAQRLWGLESVPCRLVLDALVKERFLYVAADGAYTRPTDGETRHRVAKADLGRTRRVAAAS